MSTLGVTAALRAAVRICSLFIPREEPRDNLRLTFRDNGSFTSSEPPKEAATGGVRSVLPSQTVTLPGLLD